MEANFINFDHEKSDERMREILDSAEAFDEVEGMPSRSSLTYTNGFYVNCTALFIDIRGSSKLAENHKRPVLGKLYRAYLSECVAVMNGNETCGEVFINGDCVSGIFNTPSKTDVDSVFRTAAALNSTVQLLNWRLEQKGYAPFLCGIGMDYGRALMLKAGYKGSAINDVIWMGDVVNQASNLCHEGSRDSRRVLQISKVVHQNLNDWNKNLLKPVAKFYMHQIDQYEGDIVIKSMEEYLFSLQKNAKEAAQNNNLLAALLYPRQGWQI